MKITVCVTGGRDYRDYEQVDRALRALDHLKGIALIVEGGAPGADRLAWQWAMENSVPVETVAADWATHGKKAGPIQNREMLTRYKPDVVLAFPGGGGTASCIKIARQMGLFVMSGTGELQPPEPAGGGR